MNRRRLSVIGVLALSIGTAVSLPVYRRLLLTAALSRPEAEVIIAADDLQVGAKNSERDLRVVKYPAENLPAHVFRRVGSIVGRGVVLPIEKGEFIVADRLAGENGVAGLFSF